MKRRRRAPALQPALALLACVATSGLAAGPMLAQRGAGSDSARADSLRADSLRRRERNGLIPAGFGTLRQDEIALVAQNLGLVVKAIPLDESVIRTLAPDSYNNLRKIRESRARDLEGVRSRLGLPAVQSWYITFFNSEKGEARYDAADVLVRSAGRDFRPLEVLGLKPGFGDGRLAQFGTQSALYAFDPAINLAQPLAFTIGTQTSNAWSEVLRKIELERSLVWSRAGAAAVQKKP
jgi:hypothetical protein